MLMTIKETAFRLHCPLNAVLKGLRIQVPADDFNGFAKARVWIEPGIPMMSNLVEAPIHLWNKGLNPMIVVPADSDIVVTISGTEPSEVDAVLE